jgi:hypothetical protein
MFDMEILSLDAYPDSTPDNLGAAPGIVGR